MMVMRMKYNEWFYRTHAYLQNAGRNGLIDYNDTKWVNMNDRYRRLAELNSHLFAEQPFGVISNHRGFNKLIDLMEESNYTFEDINDSLIDTYNKSLTNAMSRMLVNTHAVMFKGWNTNNKHIVSDRLSRYYIIDIPFNQLHFGDRDEFIRQQLSKMHTTFNEKYIPLNEFATSPYTDLLGFTLLCSVNGKFSNDCHVAIDDKGFKFKVGWPYDYQSCYFVIYKLDACKVLTTTTTYQALLDNTSHIDLYCDDAKGMPCIINLYDPNYSKTAVSVPNFATLDKGGLTIHNLQQKTLDDFEKMKTKNINVTVYALKYLHEVPDLYPAVNYYDIVDTRRVYVDSGDRVVDGENKSQVYGSNTTEVNELEICTPPIVLDKSASTSFSTIVDCLRLRDNMIEVYDIIKKIGLKLSSGNVDSLTLATLKSQMGLLNNKMQPCYKTYIEGALLTSLVDSDRMDAFEKFMTNVSNFIVYSTTSNLAQYTDYSIFPELYDEGFIKFVDYVVYPFKDNALSPFVDIIKTTSNYFTIANSTRFNRPVSEQCFIALRYDREDDCWVFDVPEIKHFKGISNAFYINNDLKGDEIYKFFVLYTDTEDPYELNTTPLTLDQVFDFDAFYDEVEKHRGYIKYWNAENKVMKMSKIIYNDYSEETAVQVLSKILKRKLEGVDIIDQYPTEMNYESSNASSLNYNNYDETSDEAPLIVNFLFYTIAMMNGNEDALQSYFYRTLLKRTHSNRYADIDISSALDRSYMAPVNYSVLSISPTEVDSTESVVPINPGVYAFYSIPFLVDDHRTMITSSPYRYSFNVFENLEHYPMLIENDLFPDNYIGYKNIVTHGASTVCYRYDINIARLLTRYLIACYDLISYLQTWYRHPFNANENIAIMKQAISDALNDLSVYTTKHYQEFVNPDTLDVVSNAMANNFGDKMYQIAGTITSIRSIRYNGRTKNIEDVANEFLKILKSVHKNTGFDDGVEKRVVNLYNHFKKINHLQSIYDFEKWVEGIDLEMIENLDAMRSENQYGVYGEGNIFKPFFDAFDDYVGPAPKRHTADIVRSLETLIDGLFSSNYESHFKPIIEFCEDIIENWIFDFYTLDDIKFDNTVTYPAKPYVITVDVNADDRFHPKVGRIIDLNSTMIFQPIVEKANSDWTIKAISKICEYAFFEGSDLSVTLNVMDASGNVMNSISGTMKFLKIGTSADEMVTFNQYPNMKNTRIDIQNVHEEFEQNSDEMIVNRKFDKMNYELLMGNSFRQLDHTSELVLERSTMLPGSVDRLYLPGYVLNKLANRDFGQHASFEVYFKPSQVLHLPIEDGEMTSVGGKYFVGQTLYLVTEDQKLIFPIIVTATDMSESNGFVEAEIDQLHAKWIKLDDINDIKHYMEDTIECTVIDDNISNFLDEYSNSSYNVYQIPEFPQALDPSDEDNLNAYSMPGDPIYVTSNAPYVYTRLNWIFDSDVPNRYMDTNPQDHHMIYVGSTSAKSADDIKIKLINHSFEPFTLPEEFPVLRTEPDDHFVWAEERRVFAEGMKDKKNLAFNISNQMTMAWRQWGMLPPEQRTKAKEMEFKLLLEDLTNKYNKAVADYDRYNSYLKQLEYPTTWYNVRTYETAMVYITNGRAPRDISRVTNIRNIPYTDKLKVYIYDWEHHYWVDPAEYTVTVEVIDSVQIGEFEDYKTTKVMNSITIEQGDGFPSSSDILIYFAYDQSDVFDSITLNPKTCDVRFKPLLTLDSSVTDYDPYQNINVRKHFDGNEKYIFEEYSEIDNFTKDGYLINRPERSGKYVDPPELRYCNLTAHGENTDLTYEDFDLYIRMPFKDVTSTAKYLTPSYEATIIQPIDGFIPDQNVKLICISNNDYSVYDGNISSLVFEGRTSLDGSDQVLTITGSTLPNYIAGTFTCTVLMDSGYPVSGGVVSIEVTSNQTNVIAGNWVRIPDELATYKELPDEFVVVPKSPISEKITIELHAKYVKEIDDTVSVENDGLNNPFEYYFNKEEDLRYPIGDVRKNDHTERLVIDQTLNPDVKLVKSTYISICRYACQKIPKDGIIDMTGYLPTPLSRDHYEFWVNGRCIKDKENLKILSPTSIQLINLKSLRNFECVELVDDTNDSILSTRGPVYIDLDGKTYASMKLTSGKSIYAANVQYSFNANNQQPLHTKTRSIISNPNNKNIERDILETVTFNDPAPVSYKELFNVPSINGVDLYDPKSYHLGLIETPNTEILKMFDKVWRREQCTNPVFPSTHMINMNLIDGEKVILHSRYSGDLDQYILYATGVSKQFFTFYISKSSSAPIDDTENTLKIIPFIRTGVFAYVEKSYQGRWLCCTHPNVKPIKIM